MANPRGGVVKPPSPLRKKLRAPRPLYSNIFFLSNFTPPPPLTEKLDPPLNLFGETLSDIISHVGLSLNLHDWHDKRKKINMIKKTYEVVQSELDEKSHSYLVVLSQSIKLHEGYDNLNMCL